MTNLPDVKEARGFYRPEVDGQGNRFVWTEPTASIAFPLTGRKPLQLRIALRSAAIGGGPDVPVHVFADGREIAQVQPDPRDGAFQVYRLPLPRPMSETVRIGLHTTPFLPIKGDRRTLGTMVQSIGIDKQEAWSSIRRRLWLYWVVPVLGLVALACVWVARRPLYPAASWIVLARHGALAACAAAGGCMAIAVVLLLRIGRIDLERYELWLWGSVYLAVFFAIVAVHLPVGIAQSDSLYQRFMRADFIARHRAIFVCAVSLLLLTLPALMALHFHSAPGMSDLQDKLRWMHALDADGLVRGFAVSHDNYPPGTYVTLYVAAKAAAVFGLSFLTTYKLSLVLFLFLSGLVMMLWTRHWPIAVLTECALILDSTVLGYNDVYFIPSLVLSLWALHAKRPVWFAALFMITCLIKWQPAILAPIVFVYAVQTMRSHQPLVIDIRRASAHLAIPVVTILGMTLFIFGGAFTDALRHAVTEHWLSANALNFDWVLTRLLHGHGLNVSGGDAATYKRAVLVTGLPLQFIAKAMFAGSYGVVLVRFLRDRRTFDNMLIYAYLGYLAYFLFNTSVHENHLVPAVILAALLWWRDARYRPVLIITAVILNLNLYLFYGLDGVLRLPLTVHGLDLTLVLALVNVGLFVALLLGRHTIPHRERDGLERHAESRRAARHITVERYVGDR